MMKRVHGTRADSGLPRSYRFGVTAVSALAIAALLPQAALAQEAPAEDAGDEIVVSGIRYSLANSINTKKNETSIVEAVSAEEIGKLPDVSIAESIARLPGLAAQRVSGRAQIISVRGLPPDFATVLLNGRAQASSGYNRAVEFDQYPSELLSSVVVYKSPDARITGMGLSGSVDLRTVRPLAYGKDTIAISLRAELDEDGGRNADMSKWGGRGSISIIGQNDAGTLGWALGYAYLDAPGHVDHFKAYSYESFGFAVTPDSADSSLQLNGQEAWAVNSRDKRHGFMGTLEWQPSDTVHTTLDLYYSRFKQTQVSRGAQWFSNGWADGATFTGVQTTPVGGSTLGTSGHFNNAVPILRNDHNTREDELVAVGWNGEFQMTDSLTFRADLSYSSNQRDETYIETYQGFGVGPFQTRTFDDYDFSIPLEGYPTYSNWGLNYADANQVSLGDRAPWGGWGHDGLIKSPHIKEDITAVDLGFTRNFDNSVITAIDIGVNYTHRVKSKTVEEIDLNLKNGRAQVPIGSQFLIAPTSLDFIGFGNVIAFDLPAALDTYYDQSVLQDVNHFDKSWTINEDLLTFHVRANFEQGGLKGNVGVQVVKTWQGSEGLRINSYVSPVQVYPAVMNTDYTDVLPSLNAFYDMGGGFRLRFAAAKVMARPRMDDMRANMTPSYSNPCSGGSPASGCVPGGTVQVWSGTGGNPALKPWRAKEINAAVEWYGGDATYFSVGGFYKWLDTYIYNRTITADFSGFPVPSTVTPLPVGVTGSPIGTLTAPDNGNGGYVRGVEISGALEFGKVLPALNGFGISGSVAYTDSNLNPTSGSTLVRIPGLSDWVYNLTGYFEKDGFQLRASYRYRSAFKGEVVALFTNLAYTEVLADKQLDAQIGYTFQEGSPLEGLGIVLQVSNVLDSPYRTRLGLDAGGVRTSDGTALPETYEKYGRQWLVGISYKF